MFTEAQNTAIVRTELDKVFFQSFDYDTRTPNIATAKTAELFPIIPTEHQAFIQEIYKGNGLFPKIGEIQTVPQSTPFVTNKLTTIVADFASSVPLSKDLFDDNMHGVWARTVSDFALKARISQDENAFGIFRNAFTTQLSADGVSLVNAAHPLIGGGTQSNLVSGALSDTTFKNAMVALRQQRDQSGVIMGNIGAYLVVPSNLYEKAIQLTQSALVIDSGNNNLNIWRSAYGITVYSSPYMDAIAGGSDNAWFLLSRNHSLARLLRQGIETALTPWQYSNNRTYNYQANFREEVMSPDYAGLVGSTGV